MPKNLVQLYAKSLVATGCLVLFMPAQAQFFERDDWSVGLRGSWAKPKSSEVGGINFSYSSAVYPELLVRKDFGAGWFGEAAIGTPSRHKLTDFRPGTQSTQQTASIRIIPTSITGNMIFYRIADFDIYGGAGASAVGLSAHDDQNPGWSLSSKYSVGLSWQVGFDYTTDRGWKANFNLRHAQTRADLLLSGKPASYSQAIDPWIAGAGLLWRY